MQETLEQVLDYLKGIWLKRRYLMVATWLICPMGWLAVSQLDDVYLSEARVFADTQSILGPLLKGMTVESNPEQQVQLMVKTLLSRPNLERISRMSDIDIEANTPEDYEKLILRLKEDIKVQKTGGYRQNLFNISFEDKSPYISRNVVQSVISVFIENTHGENRQDSDTAQKFLTTQINNYENRLSQAESRLTAFRQKYSSVLPNSDNGYYQQLNSAKKLLKEINLLLLETTTQLNTSKDRLNKNTKSNSNTKIMSESSIKTTFDERISELEIQLDNLQLRYTKEHPDVKEIIRRLEHINKQRENEIQQYTSFNQAEDNQSASLSDNPVIQEIQIHINKLEVDVSSLKVRADDQKKTVQELENKIFTLPEIEAELVALNRGYDITKKQYESLVERQEKALIAQKADETTSKINFKVIDPPRVPLKPKGPKRILFYFAVCVIAVGIGLGLSFVFSQLNPVVTSSSQVSKATGIPIFGIVSAAENLGLQGTDKRKTILFIISNSLLVLLLCFFIAYTLFPEAVKAPLHRIYNL